MHRTTLRAKLALGGTLALASFAAIGPAQASTTLPTLTLTVTKTSITVGGSMQSGAVNVVSTGAPGLKEATSILYLQKPGVTVA